MEVFWRFGLCVKSDERHDEIMGIQPGMGDCACSLSPFLSGQPIKKPRFGRSFPIETKKTVVGPIVCPSMQRFLEMILVGGSRS